MVLAALEETWPVAANLYTSMVLNMEVLRMERMLVAAAELHDPARLDRLMAISRPNLPTTVASRLHDRPRTTAR